MYKQHTLFTLSSRDKMENFRDRRSHGMFPLDRRYQSGDPNSLGIVRFEEIATTDNFT